MGKKVEIIFREYVGVRPSGNMKAHRIHKPKLMEDFIEYLIVSNGGLKEKPEKVPVIDENGNIEYYLPEPRMVNWYDYSVINGKVFVDWVNGKIVADADLKYGPIVLGDAYSMKKVPRVKRVKKVEGEERSEIVHLAGGKERWYYNVIGGDEDNRVSHMDKYSYKCAVCNKVYGYKHKANACSIEHIPYGKIAGDYFSAGIADVKPFAESVIAVEVVA